MTTKRSPTDSGTSQLALAILTAKDDRREPAPPEAAQSGVIAGVTIKLTVIAGQLRALIECIDAISVKTAPTCAKHPDARRANENDEDEGIFYLPARTTKNGASIEGSWFCGPCMSKLGLNPSKLEFNANSAICDVGQELAALKHAIGLTTSLASDLQRELSDAAEPRANANGQPISR